MTEWEKRKRPATVGGPYKVNPRAQPRIIPQKTRDGAAVTVPLGRSSADDVVADGVHD
jgi:hypothetical protein